MLDIKFIRENPEEVSRAMQNRGVDFDMKYLLDLDARRRAKIAEVDEMRARQNDFVEAIACAPASERQGKIEESRALKEKLGHREFEMKALEEEFVDLMRRLPNIPLPDAPIGKDERDHVVVREVGEKPQFDFMPRDYTEIVAGIGLVDTERAGKVSGSRFGYLTNEAALLEFALVRFALERLMKKGFVPIVPPVMIREEMMRGMGYIDTDEDREERYFLEKDKLFLVGTGEQSVVPMHADEIFDEKDLPRRYAAFSTCFRREAGSYGKDTKGILRAHQFDKVEMVTFTKPGDSASEHEFLLAAEEELMQELKIPYRVVALATGDLSRPSAATYDIEAWLPGQDGGRGQYRETHSCSNTTDFQARRLNIKYESRSRVSRQPEGSTSTIVESVLPLTRKYVHILNGTAFAIGRMIIAILENYQQGDGSALIPGALQPYMGGMRAIGPSKK